MKESLFHAFTNRLDEIVAFISGDVLATYLSLYFFLDFDWIHPLLKVLIALFVGIFGGVGGLIGKDLYTLAKKKLK